MLSRLQSIALPFHPTGGFDHGDVHLASGRVFVAHTSNGTVEIIDGERGCHSATVGHCPEASGVVCAQEEGLVFAAARGAGKVLVLDAVSGRVLGDASVGPRPNGLAWSERWKRLLVADVEDLSARLIDSEAMRVVVTTRLPGRPRWCVYDALRDRFLVNVRDPACVTVLTAENLAAQATWKVRWAGPHGLDLDIEHDRAFVACDDGNVLSLDLATGTELAAVEIAGEPDAIWYNRRCSRLYVAIGRPGVLDVIDCRDMVLRERLPTELAAHTTAFDALRQRLYVFLPQSCQAIVYQEVESA